MSSPRSVYVEFIFLKQELTISRKLDDRYFRGLEGRYLFQLRFLLRKKNAPAGDYVLRVTHARPDARSVSAAFEVPRGTEAVTHEVVPIIEVTDRGREFALEHVLRQYNRERPNKLRLTAQQYDDAHRRTISESLQGRRSSNEQLDDIGYRAGNEPPTAFDRTDPRDQMPIFDPPADHGASQQQRAGGVAALEASSAWNPVCVLGLRVHAKGQKAVVTVDDRTAGRQDGRKCCPHYRSVRISLR